MFGLLLPLIGKVLDRVLPDKAASEAAKLELFKAVQTGELAQLDADVKLALGQIEINKAEASNPSLFVSGWRPAVGWLCSVGLAYTFLLQPLLAWVSGIRSIPVPPTLDLGDLMTLLAGLLGLGSLRTYEKVAGVAAK